MSTVFGIAYFGIGLALAVALLWYWEVSKENYSGNPFAVALFVFMAWPLVGIAIGVQLLAERVLGVEL